MKGRIRKWIGDIIGALALAAIVVVGLIIGHGITG